MNWGTALPSQAGGVRYCSPSGTVAEASDPSGISLFKAVEKELGLKLVKQKRSIPVIVVDHVDEKRLHQFLQHSRLS